MTSILQAAEREERSNACKILVTYFFQVYPLGEVRLQGAYMDSAYMDALTRKMRGLYLDKAYMDSACMDMLI